MAIQPSSTGNHPSGMVICQCGGSTKGGIKGQGRHYICLKCARRVRKGGR